ncbi:MAG: hypothetical protein Sapg2KO_30750 [Saprospiraceae bacterium]
MNYKFGLLFFILSLLFSCNSETENHRTTSEDEIPPNIIYIIADDMGYGDLSVYGQETLKAPNIDALAT